jgi:hypothetical protein
MHTLFTHLYNAFIVTYYSIVFYCDFQLYVDRRARDRVIVGFTTTYAISDLSGRWFSPGTPIFFTNKSNRHDIAVTCIKSGGLKINTIYMNPSPPLPYPFMLK